MPNYSIEQIQDKVHEGSWLRPIKFDSKKNQPRRVICKCKCGKEVSVVVALLINGNTLSCGCYKRSLPKNLNTKYTPYIKRLYGIWYSMIMRCYNEKFDNYRYYGGRGVIVCDEWKNDYQAFLDWSLANGYADDLEIDKDIKGDGKIYSPETCQWVTRKKNCRNKRNTVKYDFRGKRLCLSEISELTKVPLHILTDRVYAGKKNINEAVSLPINKKIK